MSRVKEGSANLVNPLHEKHYKDLRRKNIARLAITYLAPSILLIIFFIYQYASLFFESKAQHLMSVADSQAKILDLFLMERIGNMISLIDGKDFHFPPTKKDMNIYQADLKRNSESFIDLGFFDTTGIQSEYAGPLQFLEKRDYSSQTWFKNLMASANRYVVTDIYLGLRNKPHFTIGVKKTVGSDVYIIKASLAPQKIYEYITSYEKSLDIYILIVNSKGKYQLAHPDLGNSLDSSVILPDRATANAVGRTVDRGKSVIYAYSWLAGTDWAVIVQSKPESLVSVVKEQYLYVFLTSGLIILILIIIIIIRSKQLVVAEYEKDIVRTQLEHAAKLATVGELASGIAHEIGNPLNIIANEVGIMQDYANPKFKAEKSLQELAPHFDKIMKAVFRCKDITKKLLTFVRREGYEIKEHIVKDLVEDLVSGFFERELSLQNIELARVYSDNKLSIYTDSNQIRQVLINLINNAADAITASGKITITCYGSNSNVNIAVTDTGSGISQEEIDKIFLPFFTTKPVGKGTGLGLSVSIGILKNLGGTIDVESIPGKGSTFTIVLPAIKK